MHSMNGMLASKHSERVCVSVPLLLLIQQFELRYNEIERARAVFERYVEILPTVKAWVR